MEFFHFSHLNEVKKTEAFLSYAGILTFDSKGNFEDTKKESLKTGFFKKDTATKIKIN